MRTKKGAAKNKKKKRILKKARGNWGARSKLYKSAKETRKRALWQSRVGRRQKKRDYRRLWITRISAAAKMRDISYSRLMGGLKKASVELNRKMLSEIAIHDPAAFDQVVEVAREAL